MHEKQYAKELFEEQLISEKSFQQINDFEDHKNFSIKAHLDFALYAGVTLLASGLGILIYKNIDTIGHAALVTLIGLMCFGCFAYCNYKKEPSSLLKVEAPNIAFDYVLLFGSLLLLTFVGYLQFQFHVFGERYGLATFIPCILLFFVAYYFDHLGVLSMAIVLLGSWVGIVITPLELLKQNDFNSSWFIYTGIGLALFLAAISFATFTFEIKKHFYFTYFNFALHLGFLAALSGLFILQTEWLWAIVLAVFFAAAFKYALAEKSFYVLLMTTLYGYIGFTYFFINIFESIEVVSMLYLMLFYFIFSAIMLIKYLREFKKQFQLL
jgi:hypothetical protein